MIYADNAATTQLDNDALQAMLPFLQEEYGNISQSYSFSRSSKKALIQARTNIATIIGANDNEIFFTSGGSESNNWAIKGLLSQNDFRLTITTTFEHHSILNSCSTIEQLGFPVTYIIPSKKGIISPHALQEIINNHTKLVSIMFINNEIGTIQPIKELCQIAHQYNSYFHTDGVQAVGHIPLDVKDLNIDMLSASAHKFNGPKGIGFLYIKEGTKIHSLISGGKQELGMRAGTENIASIVGMTVALEKKYQNLKNINNKIHQLEQLFYSEIQKTNLNYLINGKENKSSGIISISFKNANGEMLLHRLDLLGIYVSTGSACNGNNSTISHVLQAIQVPKEYAKGTIRISINEKCTETDIKKIVQAISHILKGN